MPSLLTSLLFFALFSNVFCGSCAKNSLDRMNQCNVIIADMQSASKRFKEDPIVSIAVPVLEKCEKALKCVRTVHCSEADAELTDLRNSLVSLCGSLHLISGPVSKCVEKLRSQLPSLKYYACALFLEEKRGIMGVCPMYRIAKNYECAVKMMGEKCGEEARNELKTKKEKILKELNCL